MSAAYFFTPPNIEVGCQFTQFVDTSIEHCTLKATISKWITVINSFEKAGDNSVVTKYEYSQRKYLIYLEKCITVDWSG